MQNISDLVTSLDNHVLRSLNAFHFSDSPLTWGDELRQIFSDIYVSTVRKTKEDARVVARGFRRQHRMAGLLYHVQDLASRTGTLRVMLIALTQYPSYVPRLEPEERDRVRMGIPDIHWMVRSILERFSCWSDEVEDVLTTLSVLEEPELVFEELLASVPDAIPNMFVLRGEAIIDQLVSIWADRRTLAGQATDLSTDSQELQQVVERLINQQEEQDSIITSFAALITRIIDVPPFHFVGQDFTARQLTEANRVYRFLCIRRINLSEETVFLEGILDRMLSVVEADEE